MLKVLLLFHIGLGLVASYTPPPYHMLWFFVLLIRLYCYFPYSGPAYTPKRSVVACGHVVCGVQPLYVHRQILFHSNNISIHNKST